MSNKLWEIQVEGYAEEIRGRRVLIEGYLDCIVHRRKHSTVYHKGKFLVTELSTGAAIGGGDSKDDAIRDAVLKVKRAGKCKVNRMQRTIYKRLGELNVGRF